MIREPYVQWAEGHISRIRNVLNDARAEHTGVVKQRIDSVGQMKDVVSLTKGLFALSKVSYTFETKQKNPLLPSYITFCFIYFILTYPITTGNCQTGIGELRPAAKDRRHLGTQVRS